MVIAAYDEERFISGLLESLARQTVPPREVIVADDGSRDATASLAEAAGAHVLRLPHRGPARARNAGVAAAAGAIVVFVDADMVASPRFVERLIAPIVEERAVGTFTKEIFLANPGARWARAYAAVRRSPPERLLPAHFPDRWANFRAIRREAFMAVGGYDDVGYGEDMTLADKVGVLAVAAPGAVCSHHHPDSVLEIFRGGRWVGRGDAVRRRPRPWLDHALPLLGLAGLRQVLEGRTPWVLPARLIYHAGVLLGLLESSRAPHRHWK